MNYKSCNTLFSLPWELCPPSFVNFNLFLEEFPGGKITSLHKLLCLIDILSWINCLERAKDPLILVPWLSLIDPFFFFPEWIVQREWIIKKENKKICCFRLGKNYWGSYKRALHCSFTVTNHAVLPSAPSSSPPMQSGITNSLGRYVWLLLFLTCEGDFELSNGSCLKQSLTRLWLSSNKFHMNIWWFWIILISGKFLFFLHRFFTFAGNQTITCIYFNVLFITNQVFINVNSIRFMAPSMSTRAELWPSMSTALNTLPLNFSSVPFCIKYMVQRHATYVGGVLYHHHLVMISTSL